MRPTHDGPARSVLRTVLCGLAIVFAAGPARSQAVDAAAASPRGTTDDSAEGAGETAFSFPDTLLARRMAAFVQCYNASDEEGLRTFDVEHRSDVSRGQQAMDELLPVILQLRGATGPLMPQRVQSSAPDALAVLMELEGGGQVELRFGAETEPPHKVHSFVLVPPTDLDAEEQVFGEWTTLDQLLQFALEQGDLPGIGVVVLDLRDEGRDRAAVAGVRVRGASAPVLIGDRFHIGSVTKSVTATMVGRLVQRGELQWTTTLGEVFDDVEMRDEYGPVTVRQLLDHRAGFVAHTNFGEEELSRLTALSGSPREIRAAYVAEVLQLQPVGPAGGPMQYSNAGFAVLGHMAERVADDSWESLVQREVFQPWGMSSAGFGWPATSGRPDQPRGHFGQRPQGLEEYDLGHFIAPAGDVHMSLADLSDYMRGHLVGLDGTDGHHSAAIIAALHDGSGQPDGGVRYTGGWVHETSDAGDTIHWHNGSAGSFYALVALFPARGRGVAVVTNTGNMQGEPTAWRVIHAINERDGG